MGFYNLSKGKRVMLVDQINKDVLSGINNNKLNKIIIYFLLAH